MTGLGEAEKPGWAVHSLPHDATGKSRVGRTTEGPAWKKRTGLAESKIQEAAAAFEKTPAVAAVGQGASEETLREHRAAFEMAWGAAVTSEVLLAVVAEDTKMTVVMAEGETPVVGTLRAGSQQEGEGQALVGEPGTLAEAEETRQILAAQV